MFNLDPPCRLGIQLKYKDTVISDKVKKKLEKVVTKRYIDLTDINFMEAIMYMFQVTKGDNICMAYDGFKLGLNAAIYALWFELPTTKSMTRWVMVSSWLADND